MFIFFIFIFRTSLNLKSKSIKEIRGIIGNKFLKGIFFCKKSKNYRENLKNNYNKLLSIEFILRNIIEYNLMINEKY